MAVVLLDMTFKTKIRLTMILCFFIVASGMGAQYYYNQKKTQYTQIITGYYRKYFGREPDAIGLRYWVAMALNRWGLERVEREGFIEARKKGAT